MKKESQAGAVTGPLQVFAVGYRQDLVRQGYSRFTALAHMQMMGHVSRWLRDRDVKTAGFDDKQIGRFLTDRKASGQVRRLTPRGLVPLLGYLRGLGVIPAPAVIVPASPAELLLAEFNGYLLGERGLSPTTVVGYERVARLLLSSCRVDTEGAAGVNAASVNRFVLSDCASRNVGAAGNAVTAVRALLRFLYLHSHIGAPLADGVPRPANWRDGGRSRGIGPEHVTLLLDSCDRTTAGGRRDFAILTLLARLGLRANEVATLTLDDVDWRAGELGVTGKGDRHDRLPLPVDVGQAVAEYCQHGRPTSGYRSLFVLARAPFTAMSSSAVSMVVLSASRRAGIGPVRAHQLRHSTAAAMRRSGAPLFEIGQVLRHRHLVTTAVYAKDDLAALGAIAQVWPGTTA